MRIAPSDQQAMLRAGHARHHPASIARPHEEN
jgi:hypothetical protein